MSGRRAARVRVNGREVDHVAGTLEQLLLRQGVDPAAGGIAVALNGRVVRRAEWTSRDVRAGDQIEIVGATQGG